MRELTTIVEQADLVSDTQAIVPLPHGYAPEGVSETIIDPATLRLIEILPGGRELFVHILHYATLDPKTTMQRSLFHATGEGNNEAIVLIKNVEALAKSPNSPFKSPDAYDRRLIALETLKVIRRKVHRASYTEIRISLGKRSIHVPSVMAALWNMHETYKDEKVKQLARKMAKQIKTGEFLSYAASTCMHIDQDLVPVMRVLDALLQARGIKEEATTLASACHIIAQLMVPEKYGRADDAMGEFVAAISGNRPSSAKKSGELPKKSGELLGEVSGECEGAEIGTLTQMGESVVTNSPEFAGVKRKRHICRRKTGEFQQLFATNSPDLAPFGRVAEEMGEFVAGVSISDHYSPNNITSKETESLNDSHDNSHEKQGEVVPSAYKDSRLIEEIRRDARKYADLLDGVGNYRWMGKLVRCVQNHPENIRHLAVVDTLFHSAFPDWRGKPEAPGAWFCKAADRFDTESTKIPHEVKLWAETGLSYHDIDQALQQGRRTPMDHLLPLTDGDDEQQFPLEGEQEYDQQEPDVTPSLESSPMRGSQSCSGLRTRMNRSQAEDLCSRILREGIRYGIVAEVRRGERGSSVVVTTWEGTEETHMNEGEWDRYFKDMKSIL